MKKKVFSFWRRKVESHSCASDLQIGPAQPGYNLRTRDLKKLHKAVSVGDLEKVQKYLQLKKHDVNIRDKEHRTPLHLACASGYPNIVSVLIEKQCKINVQDRENRSPLDGYTPLLLAITENNAEMVEFLLKKGADVNASDNSQRTALMIALSDEPTNLVSVILQQDVDLSCQDIMDSQLKNMLLLMVLLCKYHQLMANYGKEKKIKKTSYSESTTLSTMWGLKELEEVYIGVMPSLCLAVMESQYGAVG
ncbi:PREDICTED: LOW QUALITY PROTEIN: ankyrin repeat domain-containing protein 7 [Chrysochloris asiatica]|uniref:LOW QUALITY PROTEIN: ankyrin repeat domain-containing protein 7 n=1 Tax=Chrysochloris asiatica TaxID=185453 RepID=A0A9B0TBI1_CHRAS|nr:PREDICTED: LOW QUALITY PROTEIN: ankyrin repeat domain-containing protein 7 [Chrysochloris asiatica]